MDASTKRNADSNGAERKRESGKQFLNEVQIFFCTSAESGGTSV
jgi:hypothetical protein